VGNQVAVVCRLALALLMAALVARLLSTQDLARLEVKSDSRAEKRAHRVEES
jgi:hypothetical protein